MTTPDYVVVFGADNIYRMDVSQMVAQHIDSGLDCTVAGIRVPRKEASAFGIIDADVESNIRNFLEKPADPPGLPDSPEESFASMGNYVFTRKALVEALEADAADQNARHDMGGDIIPYFVSRGRAQVHDFSHNTVPGASERDKNYWRDVGTIDAYHEAHMDLVSVVPNFSLYNSKWPIWTNMPQRPGAKFVLRGHGGGFHRLPPGHDHLRRRRGPVGAGPPERTRGEVGQRAAVGDHGQCADRPQCRDPQGDHRQVRGDR